MVDQVYTRILDEKETNYDRVCPFCNETGFDKIGLKYHLLTFCDEWKKTGEVSSLFKRETL